MEDESGSDTIGSTMSPAPDPRHMRSGEWSTIREAIETTVRDAVKQVLDDDSGINRAAEQGNHDDMNRMVSEIKSSVLTSMSDLRQHVLERLNENSSELKTMVREEVGPLRVQVGTMEITLKDLQEALHKGDTRFAVIGTRLDTLQSEVDRVRDTPPARPARRDATTDKHRKDTPTEGTEKLSKSPFMNIALTALLTAACTAIGMWAMDIFGKGAKAAVQEVGKVDHRQDSTLPKDPKHTTPPEPTANHQ